MSNLLYSSNEMYSSTELIRKSKLIFDKIISNEISKAIILRDGKPSFMLLDFNKYEKIMSEYDKLKAKETRKKNTKTNKPKKDEAVMKVYDAVIDTPEIVQTAQKVSSAKIVPPMPTYKEEIVEDIPKVKDGIDTEDIKKVIEQEVKEGLEVLNELDFDDKFKEEVARKVREKKDREVAAKKAEQALLNEMNEITEEPKEVVSKTQLKEFWA